MHLLYKKVTKIPLNKLIHNNLSVYINSGYGGKVIDDWPFYNFICLYLNNNKDESRKLWTQWLASEFYKNCTLSKKVGGMFNGSIHKFVINNIKDESLKKKYYLTPKLIPERYLLNSINNFIDKKYILINSIKKNGFIESKIDKITSFQDRDFYILKGGHHRVAILKSLNYDCLNQIYIYNIIYKFLKKYEV